MRSTNCTFGPLAPVFVCLFSACGQIPPAPGQDAGVCSDSGACDTSTAAADTGRSEDHQDSGADTSERPEADLLALTQPPRNLLVISIDTLRQDHVGAYGGGADTPFLDELASQGVRLARHHACSGWTYPGAICAMTGTTAVELGFFPEISDEDGVASLPEGTPTLAAALRAEGYQTALLSSNVIIGEGSGLARGFESAPDLSALDAEALTSSAINHVDRDLDPTAPWMMHVHYVDPHAPYAPPDAYLDGLDGLPELPWDLGTLEGSWAAVSEYATLSDEDRENLLAHVGVRYAGEVRYTDDAIAALFSALDDRGLLDGTLVLLWTDHGEQLGEHGGLGHGGSLFGEESDAVALFWSRDLQSPGVWAHPTSNKDLAPTTLRLLGVDIPTDMSGEIVGEAAADRGVFDTLLPKGRPPVQTVTVGDVKLLYNWNGTKRLYYRDVDPQEQDDLYDAGSNEVEQLWELMLPRVDELQAVLEGYEPVDPGP